MIGYFLIIILLNINRTDKYTLYNFKKEIQEFGIGVKAKVFIKGNLPYKLKMSFYKRHQVFDGTTWIGTTPIILNEGY